MVNASLVKLKLDAVVSRIDLKRTICINHYTLVRNDINELVKEFDYQDTFDGIILSYIESRMKYDPAGSFDNSEFVIITSSSTEVSKYDTVLMFDKEYKVTGINKTPLGNELVVQKIFVVENLEFENPLLGD